MQATLPTIEAVQTSAPLVSRARVVVISQFFGQEQSAVGQFLADFANEALLAGHEIHVICGDMDYAGSDVAARTSGSHQEPNPARISEGSGAQGGIRMTKVRTAKFSQNKLQRLVSYSVFFAGAAWKALTIPNPNVVVTLTAPPGLSWIGWLVRRIRRCRHVTWEMDLYPDIAIALGIPLTRWTAQVLDFPRRRADAVIVPGACMKARLLWHHIPEDRIVVVENWADGRSIIPLPLPSQPPLCILYSGNLGLAHDVATLRVVIERLAGRPEFLFAFAGGGLERDGLIDFCHERGITNVAFLNYVRKQDLGARLAECHVGLVTQKPATLGAVVPSKVYGLMAAGRPILYIGPAAATPAHLIRRFDCGWHFDCGDAEGVSALLVRILKNPDELSRKGQNGHRAFVEHYDKPAGASRVLQALRLETRVYSQWIPASAHN